MQFSYNVCEYSRNRINWYELTDMKVPLDNLLLEKLSHNQMGKKVFCFLNTDKCRLSQIK